MNGFKNTHRLVLMLAFVLCAINGNAQPDVLQKIKEKHEKVKDYVADGTLKIDVHFINAPVSKVKVYYKKPDQFKVVKDGGISILPKGGIHVDLNSLQFNGNSTVVEAGASMVGNSKVKVFKILPLDDDSEVLLTTLYVDEKEVLIRRSKVTTRDNGTYEMDFYFGKYKALGLPDKVIFSFDTKDYKLPKGITFEYESGAKKQPANQIKNKKGTIEISYNSYNINKGIPSSFFKD